MLSCRLLDTGFIQEDIKDMRSLSPPLYSVSLFLFLSLFQCVFYVLILQGIKINISGISTLDKIVAASDQILDWTKLALNQNDLEPLLGTVGR